MLLYIIRHGQPIYGPDTLTDLGRAQADALADRLKVYGLNRIYSSPMGRARETAAPTAAQLGLPVEILPWTKELWPEFTLTREDGSQFLAMDMPGTVYRSDEYRTLGDDWHTMAPLASIEAKRHYDAMVQSSDAFLEDLGYKREGGVYRVLRENHERVAVFCHGGFSAAWLSHLLSIPPHLFWAAFTIGHSCVTVLEFGAGESGFTAPKCLVLSDMGHIFGAGLPLVYNGDVAI